MMAMRKPQYPTPSWEYSNWREAGFMITAAMLIAIVLSAMFYGFEKFYEVFVASRLPDVLR